MSTTPIFYRAFEAMNLDEIKASEAKKIDETKAMDYFVSLHLFTGSRFRNRGPRQYQCFQSRSCSVEISSDPSTKMYQNFSSPVISNNSHKSVSPTVPCSSAASKAEDLNEIKASGTKDLDKIGVMDTDRISEAELPK